MRLVTEFQGSRSRRFIMRHLHRSSRGFFVSVILLLLLAAAAWVDITGSISGVVKDPNGAVIPQASVAAVNVNTGIRYQAKSDNNGFYSFNVLPIGTYTVEVQAQGFKGF